jgi:hypothetical protein
MVVAKVEGETVTFRYEGLLELMTIEAKELRDKPDTYRPAEPAPGSPVRA